MKTTASGLQWGILKQGGDGPSPGKDDTVEVHYTGWLTDGTKFDSSRDRGKTTKFGVTQVIKGWTEGLQLMKPGMRCKFIIPGELAYGAQGRRPTIPPNATLVFDVELVSVVSMPKFQPGNPDKQKAIEEGAAKGAKVEILKVGTGAQCGEGVGVDVRYAIWKADGTLLDCSERQGRNITGSVDALPVAFLKPLVQMCKVGQVLRVEVPQTLWGRAQADTVWELELKGVTEMPKFRQLDKAKLKTTDSGLKYEVIKQGEGDSPKATQTVVAHYTGWLTDGTLFDSSHARGEPTSFPLSGVIKGWTEGLQLMKPGGTFLFEIPGDLAYGKRGSPPKIGPDATLIFLVELVSVK